MLNTCWSGTGVEREGGSQIKESNFSTKSLSILPDFLYPDSFTLSRKKIKHSYLTTFYLSL